MFVLGLSSLLLIPNLNPIIVVKGVQILDNIITILKVQEVYDKKNSTTKNKNSNDTDDSDNELNQTMKNL